MHLKASSSLSCCQSRRPFGQLSVRHAPLRSTRSGRSAVPQAALRSAAVAAATQGTVSAPGAPSPGFVAHLAGRSGAQQQRPRLQPVRVQQMDDPRAVASAKEGNVGFDDLIKYFGITVGIAVAAAAGAMYIDTFSTEPCTVAHTCDTIGTGIKVALVATHLYTFLLVPATMYVFYDKIQSLKDQGARSPFTALVGLGYIMVAIAGEIGWHVTQDWYYKEEYAVLNLCFYIFLVLGLSMWAYGIRIIPPSSGINAASGSETNSGLIETIEELSDKFLFAAPVLTGGFYLAGAAVLDTKVPIYILMLLVFVVLTGRFYNLLKTPWVLLFPLFSVGVNLGFIGLLDKYQQDAFLNPLFHILHDAAGTELGIAIIAVLVYLEPMRLKEQQQQKQLK